MVLVIITIGSWCYGQPCDTLRVRLGWCKRMVWCCHLQIWLIQIRSELPEKNKELTVCLYSAPWTYATVQVWPQQQILLFPQSTHLPPMLWISQLTKYDSRVKYMYFHIAWGQNTSQNSSDTQLKKWLNHCCRKRCLCWSCWGYSGPCTLWVTCGGFQEECFTLFQFHFTKKTLEASYG